MPKIKVALSAVSSKKISDAVADMRISCAALDDSFGEHLTAWIKDEIRSLRDCSQKSVIDAYCSALCASAKILDEEPAILSDAKAAARKALAKEYTDKDFDDNIDIYFNEVKREYIIHPQNESYELEFLPENRDIFIKNNLKLVVSCAKRFRNMGVPFEDLIQAGNEGLLTAFGRFDSSRACLRNAIIKAVESAGERAFTKAEAEQLLQDNMKYSSSTQSSVTAVPVEGFQNASEFIAWIKKNIKTAVFASVAFQWIRAYIIQELRKYGTVVRMGKDDDASKTIIYLDSVNPYTDDNYSDNELSEITNEEFAKEDDAMAEAQKSEFFKDIIDEAMSGLPSDERRIIKKHFGIGFPYALTPQEISENEKIPQAEVKRMLEHGMQVIKESIPESSISLIQELI